MQEKTDSRGLWFILYPVFMPLSRDTSAHRPVGSVVPFGVILHVIYFSLFPRKHCQSLDVWFCTGKRSAKSISWHVLCSKRAFFSKKEMWFEKNWEDLEFPVGTYIFSLKCLMDSCEEKHLKVVAGWSGLPAPSVPDARSRWWGSCCAVPLPQQPPWGQGSWISSVPVARGDFKSRNCPTSHPLSPLKFSYLSSSHFSSSSFENININQDRNSAFLLAFLRKGDALCAFNKQISLPLLYRWRR